MVPIILPCKKTARQAIFICPFCQKNFKTRIASIKNERTKSCGCYRIQRLTTHGLSKHPIYHILKVMKQRCYNSNDKMYNYYGARGISICKEWRNDFNVFYNWCMKNGYKNGLEIDRRNNEGNYTPENCRFVDRHIQIVNRRISKKNKSGFVGISWDKKANKWQSNIRVNNKRYYLGLFKEKLNAVQSRNDFIIENNLTEYKIQVF